MMTDRSMDFLEKQSAGAAKALEVLREELPLQRFVGENLGQAVVEGEVALPGGLRENHRAQRRGHGGAGPQRSGG